jgi:SOS response regulatory protein OraA/RecX
MRTKRSLFQKGFMMDEINRFIDEQVADEWKGRITCPHAIKIWYNV